MKLNNLEKIIYVKNLRLEHYFSKIFLSKMYTSGKK